MGEPESLISSQNVIQWTPATQNFVSFPCACHLKKFPNGVAAWWKMSLVCRQQGYGFSLFHRASNPSMAPGRYFIVIAAIVDVA